MCLRAFGFTCVLMLCGTVPSFAQQTGPRTLENLLNSDEARKPAVAAEAAGAGTTDAGPKRPAGTLARPKNGVQHPDLDKAWDEYDAAVGKVAESLRAAIAKQFDAATAKGDLDAAEKWQVIGEKFEKTGELPAEKETKAAVNAAGAHYKEAREELTKAYDAVVKSLTVQKKIAEAKAVRAEFRSEGPENKIELNQDEVFLSDLQERDVRVGWGALGKNGDLGYDGDAGRRVVVGAKYPNKSISMHPVEKGVSRATFDVPEGMTHFVATAALNDGANGRNPLTFKVFGDKALLWTSRPLWGIVTTADCRVALKGAKVVTLVVECPGSASRAWAVWIDPKVVAK